MMPLPASIAASSDLIDLKRPTKSGITICGKTTTSRKGFKVNGTVIENVKFNGIDLDKVIVNGVIVWH